MWAGFFESSRGGGLRFTTVYEIVVSTYNRNVTRLYRVLGLRHTKRDRDREREREREKRELEVWRFQKERERERERERFGWTYLSFGISNCFTDTTC